MVAFSGHHVFGLVPASPWDRELYNVHRQHHFVPQKRQQLPVACACSACLSPGVLKKFEFAGSPIPQNHDVGGGVCEEGSDHWLCLDQTPSKDKDYIRMRAG
jgi:hypothetical protein